jgi:hypothetical protein
MQPAKNQIVGWATLSQVGINPSSRPYEVFPVLGGDGKKTADEGYQWYSFRTDYWTSGPQSKL